MTGSRILARSCSRAVLESPSRTRRTASILGALVAWSFCTLAAPPVAGGAPFVLTPPPFLGAATVSRAALGNTYAYLARNSHQAVRLMITTMRTADIRAQFGQLGDVQCVNSFVAELRTSHQRLFVVAMPSPLAVGPRQFLRYRWTGDKNGKTLTGVLSCGELQGYYYVLHFVDELKAATLTFPAIRASLAALRPTPE